MIDYYQQSGRVGRDGKLADSIMRELFSPIDQDLRA